MYIYVYIFPISSEEKCFMRVIWLQHDISNILIQFADGIRNVIYQACIYWWYTMYVCMYVYSQYRVRKHCFMRVIWSKHEIRTILIQLSDDMPHHTYMCIIISMYIRSTYIHVHTRTVSIVILFCDYRIVVRILKLRIKSFC